VFVQCARIRDLRRAHPCLRALEEEPRQAVVSIVSHCPRKPGRTPRICTAKRSRSVAGVEFIGVDEMTTR
jgi:hypothetical protein